MEPAAIVGALHSTILFMHWLQSFSSAFVPCSVTLPMEASLTLLSTAPVCLTGQCLAAVGHNALAPGCRSLASLSWREMFRTTPLLEPTQPSYLGKSGLSISSGVPLVGVAGATIQRVSALGCGHPGQVPKPLKSALCHLGCYCHQFPPLLSCHL